MSKGRCIIRPWCILNPMLTIKTSCHSTLILSVIVYTVQDAAQYSMKAADIPLRWSQSKFKLVIRLNLLWVKPICNRVVNLYMCIVNYESQQIHVMKIQDSPCRFFTWNHSRTKDAEMVSKLIWISMFALYLAILLNYN